MTCVQAEADLYSKSGVLVQLLQEWRSDAATLPARLEALVIELYERQYLGLQVGAHQGGGGLWK
jgi:ribosomal protein L10